ncbi:DUF1800 family protein [Marinoscillum sp. MHG1-6]|uniref:DUF1800 domain-containing protein n=1 Tax=Marinoscillum sp. MHG1-6 TaxID=2959627 RepID=UPI00215891DC|nr:DUF1800 domain-containing protein [Marinoscillum sp. MHG1-6]
MRRTCFGASITDIDTFAALTPAQAFAQIYDTNLPSVPLPIDPATGSEWITTGTTDANSEEFDLRRFLNAWQVRQMLAADVPDAQQLAYKFRERLVFFLHTLFTTKQSIVANSRSLYYQSALFRKYAFDREDGTRPAEDPLLPDVDVPVNLKALTNKISVENAMLVFLDGRYNVKGSPNENYAREMLELFSIGRGLEGFVPEPEFDGDYYNYTETDVQEAARVFSGFNFDDTFSNLDLDTDLPRGVVRGDAEEAIQHDNGTKTFSARLDGATISPDPNLLVNGAATEDSALEEISQLVDLIYSKEETAINICRRLYRFFVYHEINDVIQAGVIQDMADVFVANNFKIYPVLEALFTSEEFYGGGVGYDDDQFGSIIKSPLDVVIGFVNNFEITIPDFSTEVGTEYEFARELLSATSLQGMDYYEPFEVAGYPAYHQFPIYNRSWITTNYLTSRYDFVAETLANGIGGMDGVDLYAFVRANIPDSTARVGQDLIISLAEYFLPVSDSLSFSTPSTSELTPERLNYFLDAFLYRDNIDVDPEASWTFRYDNQTDLETMSMQLSNLFNALLQSPEYQLM